MKITSEEKKQLALLSTLEGLEEFKLWRDGIALYQLNALKARRSNPLELSEVELKSILLCEKWIEDTFYQVFESLKAQKELNGQEEN